MMNNITWAEFKKLIEKAGVKDSDNIIYIDVSTDITFEIKVDRDINDIRISD